MQRQFPGRVRDQVLQNYPDPSMQYVVTTYLLDDNDLMWYQSDDKKHELELAISHPLVWELVPLLHAMCGHPRIAATRILLRECFFWTTMTRGARDYVLSFRYHLRKRSSSG